MDCDVKDLGLIDKGRARIEWAGAEPLWLTTYAHVPWNAPFYERHGFVAVPESACAPALLAALEEQRRFLPAPQQRIAMRRPPSP